MRPRTPDPVHDADQAAKHSKRNKRVLIKVIGD